MSEPEVPKDSITFLALGYVSMLSPPEFVVPKEPQFSLPEKMMLPDLLPHSEPLNKCIQLPDMKRVCRILK